MLDRIAPALFVILWSTGFIGAKYGLPYAEPLTFLLLRFLLVVALMAPLALLLRAPWPRRPAEIGHTAIAGLLVHAGYLSGIFAAIAMGLPAGLAALVAGLQPLLTAIAAGWLLGETVRLRQWGGLGLGLAGVVMVVWNKIDLGTDLSGLPLAVFALFSITAGTLYQKRFCSAMDLRSGTVVQYGAAALALAVLIPFFETMEVAWTGEFIFALGWLVIVLSVGAITLLYRLIRSGSASKVASLFYLVPPVTAVMAWALFGEALTGLALAGMAVTAAGVILASRT
ncbi:DMT family transporter [Telmatospirillum sp. J64-1]|uniref:DMT family transporter n=1 Tax=Telmatospirillum sp. J64-1 TaxID=2502183 RepID=UPI00115E7528|nr:DMT family transporter [Telmatospirillum sp. J64-1]